MFVQGAYTHVSLFDGHQSSCPPSTCRLNQQVGKYRGWVFEYVSIQLQERIVMCIILYFIVTPLIGNGRSVVDNII